jgi:hypothetical protein
MIQTQKGFVRNCPECNKEVYHSTEQSCLVSYRKRTLCRDCGRIKSNKSDPRTWKSWQVALLILAYVDKGNSREDVGKIIGRDKHACQQMASKLGIYRKPVPHYLELNLKGGEKFEKWEYVKLAPFRDRGREIWVVKCECGNECTIPAKRILNEKSKRCKRCEDHKDAVGHIFQSTYNKIKYRAEKVTFREFGVTKEFLNDLIIAQDFKCALTGVDISEVNRRASRDENGKRIFIQAEASVDRIDSDRGYPDDNVQWIHKDLQPMKMHHSLDYILLRAKMVCDWLGFTNYGYREKFLKEDSVPLNRVPENELVYGYLCKAMWNYIRKQGKRYKGKGKDKEFVLTPKYVNDMIVSQKFKCSLTGQSLFLPQSSQEYEELERTASLDRIDSLIGYLEGNGQWLHTDINYMKHELPQEKFIEYCRLLVTHNCKEVPWIIPMAS